MTPAQEAFSEKKKKVSGLAVKHPQLIFVPKDSLAQL
jgi:hypothetical protein